MTFDVVLQRGTLVDSTIEREDVTDIEHVTDEEVSGIKLIFSNGDTEFFEDCTVEEVHADTGETRYAVLAETVQDPYRDLSFVGPTVEADDPVEAAHEAIDRSPHSPEDIVDDELLVYEIDGPVAHVTPE